MQELEKILEEMRESSIMVATSKEHYIHPQDRRFVEEVVLLDDVEKIIRKHINDGWVLVDERLPEDGERCAYDDEGTRYMKRLEIAYMTDTIEYAHGYYDGYKWMDKYHDTIKNVVAWRIHEPYRPERSEE